MQKKFAFLIVVCLCILTPGSARADDGGFWDMLWHWDTKFSGYGTDFHIYCWNESKARVPDCDDGFRHIWNNPFNPPAIKRSFANIGEVRHEINLRVSVMNSYGLNIPGLTEADKENDPVVWAVKAMGIYYYRIPGTRLDAGAGGGMIDLFGTNVDRTWRPVFTASLAVGLGGAWFARVEENYYWGTLTGANLGHPGSTYTAEPKWAPSVALGVDFRRH
jgi:hypothetical protein